MEKHTLCETCIQEMAAAIQTNIWLDIATAFGPTIVMIIGLIVIENRRAAAQKKQAYQFRIDQNLLRRGYIFGFKTAMEDLERQRKNK